MKRFKQKIQEGLSHIELHATILMKESERLRAKSSEIKGILESEDYENEDNVSTACDLLSYELVELAAKGKINRTSIQIIGDLEWLRKTKSSAVIPIAEFFPNNKK